MRIVDRVPQAIKGVAVITFAKFEDDRGYFTETFNITQMPDIYIAQMNESYSRDNVVRGLHFQWSPYMGKLVRTLGGHLLDIILDIRKISPTFGKAIICEITPAEARTKWVWVPPGMAHGTAFPSNTMMEYVCTGWYSKGHEACISPLAKDIDWSLCDPILLEKFTSILQHPIITDKDRDGYTLAEWSKREESNLPWTYDENTISVL